MDSTLIDFLLLLGMVLAGAMTVLSLVWLIMKVISQAAVAFTVGLFLTVFSLTQFGVPEMRFGIALVLLPHLGRAIRAARNESAQKLPSFLIPGIYVFVCFLSIIWSLAPLRTALSASAWVILLLFIFTFRSLLNAETIRRRAFFILLAFFLACIVFSFAPLGWVGGRLAGIFLNANSTGIFTFLLIGISLWMGKRYWIWIIPAGTVVIILTGSRASLLAIIVMVMVILVARADWRMRVPIIGLGVSIGGPVAFWAWEQTQKINAEGSSILRTNNSRESVWGAAIDFIQDNPILGAGYRATPELIGSSSYFKLFAELGFAFAGAGIILAISYIWWSRFDIVMLGITFGTLVNTIFEDWLLTAGAPMLAVYLMLLYSSPQQNFTPKKHVFGIGSKKELQEWKRKHSLL